ncbi:mannose-6-phosphate isomerase, class I [Bacillus sp. PS06]|uniref:mannose-6-phosphate isomerase, class I n=1 Tax=Bacillus sp. PS06 TaxID=2764176 RepID=UPI0017852FF1|nr:mannose-6-phosphate isomerase, class I [Bacillus sp. PS06]MBD8069395.1 mannose-6-phosphate isomerase, class I [Bacillus sp. PS06]
MYNEPLFLKPVFQDRIWGGTALRTQFGYDIPSEQTGECWGISAHPNGPSEVINGPLKGKTLDQVWNSNRELFANQEGEEFPLLVKILDANDDLSVQVHPNDEQAVELEKYPFGKTECWYIIDCEEGAEIIYGHHAGSKEEFAQMVEAGKWNELLRSVKVKPGDFVYVPSGTIHAIGKGIQILETQQSSDITYRVYDYDRRDANGLTRKLHIEKSIAVATTPHQDAAFEVTESVNGGLTSKKLIEEKYFTVYHWNLEGTVEFRENDKYLLVSVLKGDGDFVVDGQSYAFKKGDHFIIPSTLKDYKFVGNAEIIVSHTTK